MAAREQPAPRRLGRVRTRTAMTFYQSIVVAREGRGKSELNSKRGQVLGI